MIISSPSGHVNQSVGVHTFSPLTPQYTIFLTASIPLSVVPDLPLPGLKVSPHHFDHSLRHCRLLFHQTVCAIEATLNLVECRLNHQLVYTHVVHVQMQKKSNLWQYCQLKEYKVSKISYTPSSGVRNRIRAIIEAEFDLAIPLLL